MSDNTHIKRHTYKKVSNSIENIYCIQYNPSKIYLSPLHPPSIMTMSLDAERAPQFLDSMLRTNTVVLISATYCTFCARVKTMLIELGQAFVSLEIDVLPNGRTLFSVVQTRTGINTVPQVFVRGKFLGGYDTVLDLHHQEQLAVVCGTEKTSASASSQPPPTPPQPPQPPTSLPAK